MFSEPYHHQHYRSHGANCSSGTIAPHFLSRSSLGPCPIQSSDVASVSSSSVQGYMGYCSDVKPQIDIKPNKNDISCSMVKMPTGPLDLMNGQLEHTSNTLSVLDDKRFLMPPCSLNTNSLNKPISQQNKPSPCPTASHQKDMKTDTAFRQNRINKKKKRRERGTKPISKPYR